MPGNTNAPNVTTLNTMNMQMQYQVYTGTNYVCEAGWGNKTCESTYNNAYNSYKENTYNATSDYTPVNNCGTRIFSHGKGSQESVIDERTGASLNYTAE